jgi:ABC-2 type transport system permease protein
MRTIALLVRKDLLRVTRAPLGMLVTLLFPIVFALMIGLVFGTGDAEPPRVRLLIEDQDGTMVSGFLVGAFESDQAGEYFDTTEVGADGLARIEQGEASALLRIPEGFTQKLLDGEQVTLELIRNPSESILPEIAEQTMIVLTEALDAGSRLLREPLDKLSPYLEQEGADPGATEVAAISVAFYDAIQGFEKYLLPPVVSLDSLQLEEEHPDGEDSSAGSASSGPGVFNVFLMVFPGISVWALFMLGDTAMRDIHTETAAGTLRRQLSGPLPGWKIVGAKAVYAALVALISLIILSIIGAAATDRGVDPLGFCVLSFSVILAVTGFGALVYGLARTPGQGATFSSILLLVLGFMGGAFLPMSSLPAIMQRVAPISPFYWARTGYEALLAQGGLADILPSVGVLAGLGSLLLPTGAALLGRRVRKGGAS